jgi:hypothetical protein
MNANLKLLGIICSVGIVQAQGVSQPPATWQPQEIRLAADGDHPWWTFPVTATFTHPSGGERLVLEGYWDGGRRWTIRFAPPSPGRWTYRTSSADDGLNGKTGEIDVREPSESEIAANANRRGLVKIAAAGRHFEYADGTPLFVLADTLWAGNTARCGLGDSRDGPLFAYLDDRKAKGFNAVLIRYLNGFGDVADNPVGERNEGGYAFVDGDFSRLNPEYFQALDRRFEAIGSRGMVAAIPVAWWGKTKRCAFTLDWAKRVSAYCAVRYGVFNALWCLSGEYQYAFGDCGWTPEDFDEMGAAVQAHNPYRHPLSIHPSGRIDWPPPHDCQSSRPFQQSGWLDHHWLQTGQSVDRMFNIVTRAQENRVLEPVRPVFCSESCYDSADDPDQAYHARWQAWTALASGCAGYGYGAHGMWQFYDPDDPQGETGKKDKRATPWSEALQFEGSAMMRPVRAMIDAVPWWRLEPHRERLLVDGKPSPLPTAADLTPPHLACLPGRLYMVYIPRDNQSQAVSLTGLEGGRYRARWHDPRGGRSIGIDEAPQGRSQWTVPARPEPADEDWVLVLEDAKE